MKHLIKIMGLILVVSSIYGFEKADKKQKEDKATDGSVVYKGKQTKEGKEKVFVLYLNADQTFIFQSIEEGDTNSTTLKGEFSWNKAGNQVTLVYAENRNKTTYRLQENVLEEIKEKKKSNAETEALTLQKIDLQEIRDKYWVAIEINKNKVNDGAYMFLNKENNKMKGSGGCNWFSGNYEIEEAQIKLSKIATTMKACLQVDNETELFRAFQMIDNYTISKDGQYLLFQKGKNVMVRFEVNYLKIVR